MNIGSRLTSAQLFDLFRRLDSNGDGTLDLEEFYKVSSRLQFRGDNGDNVVISEEILLNAFYTADSHHSGELTIDEFRVAYDIMYFDAIASSYNMSISGDTFVRATRYGLDKSKQCYVFQTYIGTLFALREFEDHFTGQKTACRGGLDTIFTMMMEDGRSNFEQDSHVMWWLDVCVDKMVPSVVAVLLSRLGLPNDLSNNFYASNLDDTRDSRLRIGRGVSTTGFEAESLNLFSEVFSLANVPIVNEMGTWVDDDTINSKFKSVAAYLSHRISPFKDYSGQPDNYQINALERAESIAHDDSISKDIYTKFPVLSEDNDLELPKQGRRGGDFLLSHSNMRQKQPCMSNELFSMHLMDQGFGANSLLTIHRINDEAKLHSTTGPAMWKLEQRSRAGFCGRIFRGVWKKILVVMACGGVTQHHSELADSSANLFSLLLTLAHNFNMDAILGLSTWMDVLQDQMQYTLVSKHYFHLDRISHLIDYTAHYLAPMHKLLVQMNMTIGEAVKIEAIATQAYTGSLLAPSSATKETRSRSFDHSQGQGHGQDKISASDIKIELDSEEKDTVDMDRVGTGTQLGFNLISMPKPPDSTRRYGPLSLTDTLPLPVAGEDDDMSPHIIEEDLPKSIPLTGSRGVNALMASRVMSLSEGEGEESSVLPPDSTKFLTCWDSVAPFLGPNKLQLSQLLQGDEQLEVKGTEYWCRAYNAKLHKVAYLKEVYACKLNEKRNFLVFVIAFMAVATCPVMALTSYWGMNFDNMREFDSDYNKSVPGVNLAWTYFAVIYSVLVILAFHYKLFNFFL